MSDENWDEDVSAPVSVPANLPPPITVSTESRTESNVILKLNQFEYFLSTNLYFEANN